MRCGLHEATYAAVYTPLKATVGRSKGFFDHSTTSKMALTTTSEPSGKNKQHTEIGEKNLSEILRASWSLVICFSHPIPVG